MRDGVTTPSLVSLSFDHLTPQFTVRVRGGVDVEVGPTRDERLRLPIVQDSRALESARRHPWGRDQHARSLAGFGRTVEVCGRKGAAQPGDGPPLRTARDILNSSPGTLPRSGPRRGAAYGFWAAAT